MSTVETLSLDSEIISTSSNSSFNASVTISLSLTSLPDIQGSASAEHESITNRVWQMDWHSWETDEDANVTYDNTGTHTNLETETYTLTANLDDGVNADYTITTDGYGHQVVDGEPGTVESNPVTDPNKILDGIQFGLDIAAGYSEPPEATREDVIAEYLNRLTQLYRLEAELADTTDPAMQQYLQAEIAIQQDILSGLQQQANLTASEMTDLDAQAQAAAEGNPIDLETDVELDSTAWAFASGLFTEGRYFHYLLNPSEMDSDLQTIQTYAMGTAVVAGTLAGGLQLAAYYGLTQVGTVGLTQIPAQLSLEWGLWTGTGATSAVAQQKDAITQEIISIQGEIEMWRNFATKAPGTKLGELGRLCFVEKLSGELFEDALKGFHE